MTSEFRSQLTSLALTLAWGIPDDVVDPDNHLCSLSGGAELGHLAAETFHDSKLSHVGNGNGVEVQAMRMLSPSMGSPENTDKLCAIIATIVCHDGGHGPQSLGKHLHGKTLLPLNCGHLVCNCLRHGALHCAAAIDNASLSHGLEEDSQGVPM